MSHSPYRPSAVRCGPRPLDEAVAIMLAQLLEKHGLGARVEGADAIAPSNLLRLETSGVVMVCLSYLDASSPAELYEIVHFARNWTPTPELDL
jgi:hypothetical protein